MDIQRSQTHPGVAAVLSFIFSGVGQIYNGEIKKGLFHVFLATSGLVLVLLGAIILGGSLYLGFLSLQLGILALFLLLAGGLLVCGIGIFSIYDAYKNASR